MNNFQNSIIPKPEIKAKSETLDLGIVGIYLDGARVPVFKDAYMGYVFSFKGTDYQVKLMVFGHQKYLVLRNTKLAREHKKERA